MKITGVVVGCVVGLRPHPAADRIRLADVDLGDGVPLQIVFGGPPIVRVNDLVAVAPPGSRVPKGKMRRRRYRGQVSHGMLCSLDELGWTTGEPDEVARLKGVAAGASLDDVTDWLAITILSTSSRLRSSSSESSRSESSRSVTPVVFSGPPAAPAAARERAAAH